MLTTLTKKLQSSLFASTEKLLNHNQTDACIMPSNGTGLKGEFISSVLGSQHQHARRRLF